ncbi:hypothetical protein G9A89_003288 [Geosiphon pyriformis]|nr:hypothetical protein G9A89_003288 [Geosiphon pyriformis]
MHINIICIRGTQELALRENLMLTPISIPPNATIQQKLQLCLNEENYDYTPIYRYFYIGKTFHKQKRKLTAANLTKKAILKQLHNEFKTTAGPTNSHYKLRAALRLYDLFYIYQISSIILDYYLEITDNTWTLMELSLEEKQISINNIQEKRPKTSSNIWCSPTKITQQQQIQSEVRNNLYNNLVYYLQLEKEDLNSKILATYFQELNFNIIEYCKKKYPVQSQYSIDFESETKTNNKGKQKLKQYSKTTPNTLILQKTTAKHLNKEPVLNYHFLLHHFQFHLLNHKHQKNERNHSESLESEETESEQEKTTENKEMATAYIAKISEFTGENNNTREPFENWQAFKDAFLQQFTDNNTSITFCNCFHNIKQETSETILDQFIAGLKNKLIKKVCPHAPENLATVIKHTKNYEMAMEEANHTKFVSLAIGETTTSQTNNNSNNNHKNINLHNDTTKTILNYHLTTNLKIDIGNEIVRNYKETNKTRVISIIRYHKNLIINLHHQLIIHQDHKIKTVIINQPHNQFSNNTSNLYPLSNIKHHPLNNIKYQPEDWFNIINSHSKINFRVTTTESIQIISKVAAPRSNSSNNTISSAQIAQNANLSDIFPFEFEANESPFLLSNAAANEQKAITVIYTKATVEEKPIRLILNCGSAESIITYQLMQQLQRTVDKPAQTVIVTANGMKKTPVREIDNFSFTIDEITILIKVLVINASQYQALVKNDWLLKANEKEMPLTETYMALGSTSNWIFHTRTTKKTTIYSTKIQRLQKKAFIYRSHISSEEKYETCTCYFCKACHRERFESPKRNMLPEKCNWIDVAMRGEVCDQTCQYALSISKKVRRETPFDATYNSALNKLYYYPYDAEMIFDLAIALINRATQEDVHQIKEAEYIEYTIELARFNYKDEKLKFNN